MPETDILNPIEEGPNGEWRNVIDPEVGDVMSPDYGYLRKRISTRVVTKPTGGYPYSRETQNTGHQFSLNWTSRNWNCVRRLKQYGEQYEDGFFTLIDVDGGARHYVGRFTTEVVPTPTAFDKWSVMQLGFEEVPGAPMLQYPDNWDDDAVMHYVANDFGDLKVNSSIAASGNAWAVTNRAAMLANAGAASPGVSLDTAGANGDFAQYEYRGYGFQLYMLAGPDAGQALVYLDGAQVATVDTYSAQPLNPVLVLSWPNVSLDFHRVMVMSQGAKNGASAGTNLRWWALQVMR